MSVWFKYIIVGVASSASEQECDILYPAKMTEESNTNEHLSRIISNHLVRFAIQLISNTRTNRNYSMVCISVYGRRGSFFNISCTKPLFCPEISLVRSDSHSLTLPLSSDTSQVAFHSVQHSANSF